MFEGRRLGWWVQGLKVVFFILLSPCFLIQVLFHPVSSSAFFKYTDLGGTELLSPWVLGSTLHLTGFLITVFREQWWFYCEPAKILIKIRTELSICESSWAVRSLWELILKHGAENIKIFYYYVFRTWLLFWHGSVSNSRSLSVLWFQTNI